MKYPVFSIRDNKVGFMVPNCDQSRQSAIRNFSYAINNEGVMNYAPKDFDLYYVGEFDSDNGKIMSVLPELVVSGENVYGEE